MSALLDHDLFDPPPDDPGPAGDLGEDERILELTTRLETLDAQMHATAALAYFAFEQLERMALRMGFDSPALDTLEKLTAHDPTEEGLSEEMLLRRERALAMLVEQLQWAQRNAASR